MKPEVGTYVQNGDAGVKVGRVGVAPVEAVPAEPQHAGTRHDEDDVVGGEALAVPQQTRPQLS